MDKADSAREGVSFGRPVAYNAPPSGLDWLTIDNLFAGVVWSASMTGMQPMARRIDLVSIYIL